MNHTKNKRLLYIGIAAVILLILLRFGLYFLKSDGFSGLSMLFPLLLLGFLLFAFGTSAFFAAWVYQDCKRRGDDPALWAIIVFFATPFIGLLIYFLRRQEPKRACEECGHRISLRARYCEECGAQVQNKEGLNQMTRRKTHHLKFIAAGTCSALLMLACLTGFIASAAGGAGINRDPASSERIWNTGVITMSSSTHWNGVWKLSFKSASDGFIKEEKLKIKDADNQKLYADISCGTVPEGASLTLWLVQDETAASVDVTSLSESLEYPLQEFHNGNLRVRLQINGVEDTTSEIWIE